MKKVYNNRYIIALCAGSMVSLNAAQQSLHSSQKINSTAQKTPLQKAPSQKSSTTDSQNGAQKTPLQKNSDTEKKAHPIIIHATRILPKKTMDSLHQLIKGLPAYSKNLSTQSAINPTDLQALQTGLANFAKALGEKHPYLTEEKFQPTANLDETAILNHIQVILKSLPWYIQNPKILASPIDLHDFSKQLNKLHHQIKIEENKKIQAHIKSVSAQKPTKSKPLDRVQTASLANPQLSQDQQDMLEDSDGTPINESITDNAPDGSNEDVISQSLSKKHTELSQVVSKRGRIIGSYKRTGKKGSHHIGEFKAIHGKTSLVLEGSATCPKVDEIVCKKAIGCVRNSSHSRKELTLYPYHKAPEKKHRK